MNTSELIMEAARRGAGISDEYKRGNNDLFRRQDEERLAIGKRERELRRQGVPNASVVARQEFADAHAKRHADERERTLRTAMDAISERDSREAQHQHWAARADKPVVPPREIPPGTSVNEASQHKSRDRVGERLMAQAYYLREGA